MTVSAAAMLLLYAMVVVVAVPVGTFLAEIVAGMVKPGASAPPELELAPLKEPRIAVLVPAHDEGANLLPTLADIRKQLAPGDTLLVVADNCGDDTAAQARGAGAEVIERHDATRRGKGHALDFGLRHLARREQAGETADIVIFVDADCRLAPQSLRRLARAAATSGRPVQALYLMTAGEGEGSPAGDARGVALRLREFAWRVKNRLRPTGLHALGLACQLMGTGMAVPRAALSRANFATSHLAEDLCLGLEFARHGAPPLFLPAAVVSSTFPAAVEAASSQRRRWEHGHIQLILTRAVPYLARALATADRNLAALALDLMVPPITLLGFLVGVTLPVTALGALFGAGAGPLVAAAAVLAAYILALVLAWRAEGRELLPPRLLGRAALLALGKAGFYLRLLTRGFENRWVRTDRDGGSPGR